MGRPTKSTSGELWERQLPWVLLGIGLLVIFLQLFIAFGSHAAAVTLDGIVIGVAVEVALTILAMYVVAAFLNISFGILKTAIVKLAAMIVFTSAIIVVASAVGLTGLGWLIALGVYFFLFSNFFDLDARETLLSVILISVIQAGIRMFLMWIMGLGD